MVVTGDTQQLLLLLLECLHLCEFTFCKRFIVRKGGEQKAYIRVSYIAMHQKQASLNWHAHCLRE